MKVNVVSETMLFPEKLGGMHTAVMTTVQLLKDKHITVTVNKDNDADVTHIHSFGPYALYKLMTGKHTVVTSHLTPDTFIGTYKGGRSLQGVIKSYLRFFYNHADVILSLTKESKEDLEKMGVTAKITSLPNPINTDVFKKDQSLRDKGRKEFDIPPDAFIVLGAGYLISRKGISDFVEVAKSFPDITFVWAGGKTFTVLNAETKEEKKLLEQLPANVRILGQIPYAKMPMIYNMADAFFFPSYQETQGMVIVEAAACGLPLILRDLPEYKTLYKHHYAACANNAEFARAIQTLASKKSVYKEAVKESEQLTKMYTFQALGEKLLSIYRALN